MKIGDRIQIRGSLGFLQDPIMMVTDIKKGLVELENVNAQTGGLLSHMNKSWYGIDIIKKLSANELE